MAGSEYYNHTTYPAASAAGSSASMRSELDAIEAGFDKLPALSGNGAKTVRVNAGGTALDVSKVTITEPATSATLTIADGATLVTAGAYSTTITSTSATTVTLPTTGTLSTLAGTEELTNKTLNASVAKGTWTASGTWTLPAHTLGGTVAGGGNQINNVIIGTSTPLAGSFTTLAASGAATALTYNGHTLTAGSSTFTGTAAQAYTFPSSTCTLAARTLAQAFTKTQSVTPATGLTYGASVATDAALSNNFTLACVYGTSATFALANPTNLVAGTSYIWAITQSSGTAVTISSWGSVFLFPGGVEPAISTTLSAKDVLSCVCIDGTNLLCQYSKGFA